jgi:chromosome segregation ATPase
MCELSDKYNEQEIAMENLEQELRQRDSLIVQRNQQLQDQQQVIAAREQLLSKRDETILALRRTIRQQERKIGECNQTINDLYQNVVQNGKNIEERDQTINFLNARSLEFEQERNMLRQTNASLEDRINTCSESIRQADKYREKVRDLRKKLKAAQKTQDDLEAKVQNLEKSRSKKPQRKQQNQRATKVIVCIYIYIICIYEIAMFYVMY